MSGHDTYFRFSWYFKRREEEDRSPTRFFFLYSSCSIYLTRIFPRSFAISPSFLRDKDLPLKHGILNRLSREENGMEIKSLFRYRAIRFDGYKEEFFRWSQKI